MRSDHPATLLRRYFFSPGLYSVTFRAPELVREIAAGQFVMLKIAQRTQPYLRRPYSVADASPENGEVEFLVKSIGCGTGTLEALPEGSEVRLLGPLGNAFSLSDLPKSGRVVVVAGGIGAAPFPMLFKALRKAGRESDFYFGGRNEPELSVQTRFDGVVPGETFLASDDGSVGQKGFVTDIFARRLEAGARYTRLFACGPMAMFATLAKIVFRWGLDAEFSMEAQMGCGFGACLGCVIPGTEKPFLVSCLEGPILPPESVAWPS